MELVAPERVAACRQDTREGYGSNEGDLDGSESMAGSPSGSHGNEPIMAVAITVHSTMAAQTATT